MCLIIVVHRRFSAHSGQIGGQGRKDPDGVRAQFPSGNNVGLGFSVLLTLSFHTGHQSSQPVNLSLPRLTQPLTISLQFCSGLGDTMGNEVSTQRTSLEQYREAIQFIPDALHSRIESIDPEQLSAELEIFEKEIPSVSLYWISVMQKQGIIDWSDLQATITDCINDISSNKTSPASVGVLVEYILAEVQAMRQTAFFGIHWIIELANAVNQYLVWVDSLPIHQAAANAIEVIDQKYNFTIESEIHYHVIRKGLARGLFEEYDVYKGVNMFIRADSGRPHYSHFPQDKSVDVVQS